MFRSIRLKSILVALGLGVILSTAPVVAAQQYSGAAPAQSPGICGSQPLCYEAPDFAATITSFRISDSKYNQKIINTTVRFQNKTNQPLVLGYVNQSGIATDDKGNRLVPYGPNAYRGIGLVAGSSFEPKLVIRPSGWGDAQFELVAQGFPQVVGFAYVLDLTVAQINTLEGNQHTLGGEFPLHFEGLKNGSAAQSPNAAGPGTLASSSSVLRGMAGIAGAAHPQSAAQANSAADTTAAAAQQAQAAGSNDAANTANGVSSGASVVSGVAGAAGNSQASSTAGRVSGTASAAGALAGMFHKKPKQGGQTPQGQPQAAPQQQQQNQQMQSQAPQMLAAATPPAAPVEPASSGSVKPWSPPAETSAAPTLVLEPAKLPDIVGVHLGMEPQDALQVLRKQYPNDRFQEMPVSWWPDAQKKVFYGYNVVSPDASGAPDIYLSFTAPPSKQLVWKVTRYTRKMHINRATLLAALREKYGKESIALREGLSPAQNDGQIGHLFWLFDERGGRVSMPPDAAFPNGDGIRGCMYDMLSMFNPQPMMPKDEGELARGGYCRSFVGVHVSLDSTDIVENAFTELLDIPLAVRTARESDAWQRNFAEKEHKQDLEKSKQVKPVL